MRFLMFWKKQLCQYQQLMQNNRCMSGYVFCGDGGIPLPCFASHEFATFCGKFLVRICHLFTKQNKPVGYADLLSLAKATEFDTISWGAAFCPFKGVHFFAGTPQLHMSIVHKNEYYGIIK